MISRNLKLKKINLGCGQDIREGFLNVDFEKFKGVDLVFDLNSLPYPFKENQFECVVMRNILEHLDNSYTIMQEIHRIAKKGAEVSIQTPHFSSNNVWGDLQHKRGFNTDTFKNPNISGKFQIVRQKITFSHWRFFMRPIANAFPHFYERNLAYIFPAIDLIITLKVKKD